MTRTDLIAELTRQLREISNNEKLIAAVRDELERVPLISLHHVYSTNSLAVLIRSVFPSYMIRIHSHKTLNSKGDQ